MTVYTYLWTFFVYAFLGWCGEVVFAAIVERRFVNRGFLNGPLCPIYGFGVVLIDFGLRPFGQSIPTLMVGSMILGSALEWLAGFLLEKIFHQKWWDYSDDPHNLNGYICLRFSILWGFAGMVVVGWVMPFTRRMISLIPHTLGVVLLCVLGVLALSDFIVTVVAIAGLNRRLKNLEHITTMLRQGSDKLGERLYDGTVLVGEKRRIVEQNWQKESAKLKEKYTESLQANLLHRRLLRAFPDLTSLKHNEALDALRKNIAELQEKSTRAKQRREERIHAAYEPALTDGEEKPFAHGLCFEKIFWIFMVGNVVGWALESVYAFLKPPHQFEMRTSVVIGPFILVYGLGAVVITLLLYRMYQQRDVLIFCASMIIGGTFEYLCSFFQQVAFGTVSWEYSETKLSIGGRTNLLYAFFWGILGLLWLKDIYPAISGWIQKIPKKIGRPLTGAVALFMVFDIALSAGAVYRRSERVEQKPAENAVQEFFDEYFPDELLDFIYPNMQYVGAPSLKPD